MATPAGQGNLFAATDAGPRMTAAGDECDLASRVEVDAAFLDGVRAELRATLELARNATVLPWADATRAMLAEMRMRSMSRWLPRAERDALLAAFDEALDRLYGAEGE